MSTVRCLDQGTFDYGTEAFLATRARFHLSYRLVVRSWQLLSPDGGAKTPGWRSLLAAFAALDVLLWAVLRKPERFGLKTRLMIDALDIALWSMAPYPPGASGYGPAVWIGVPLAVDAGLRDRLRGLTVPATALIVTASVRLASGRPLLPLAFAWLVLAVVCGVLLSRYIARLHSGNEHEWSARHSAEKNRSFLAGQNAVAMGADSVVDALEGVLPILGKPQSGTVLAEFANAWKQQLCQSTAGYASYLGQVLAEWAAEHNRHPDLSSRVELSAKEGIGTTLLTGAQATELKRLLTASGLRGRLSVDLVDPGASNRPPGGSFVLLVGVVYIRVPPDPNRPPEPYDPGPAIFAIGALLITADFTGLGIGIAPSAGLLGVSLGLLAACWSHRRLQRLGVAARPGIVMLSVVIAVVYTAAATIGLLRPVNGAGLENYPVAASLALLALLLGMYWYDLETVGRMSVAVAACGVLAISWLLHPVAHHPAHLFLTAGWALPLLLSGLSLSRELVLASDRYAAELTAEGALASAEAFRDGQAHVTDLLRHACRDAHEQLRRASASLSPQLAENARRRLEEVDRRLRRILPADDGSCSSTTTS